MPSFWDKIRDCGNDIPYAWYWKGKSLRTGYALGDRVQSIQVPQRSCIGDTYFYTPPPLVEPARMHPGMDTCNRCPLYPNCSQDFNQNRHQERSRGCYHYGQNPRVRQTSHCCCFLNNDCHIPLSMPPDSSPQFISEPRISYDSRYYHPAGHHCASSLTPRGYDHTPVYQIPNTFPMSPVSRVPCSCSAPVDHRPELHLGRCQCSHNSPTLQENQMTMRTNSPTAEPYPSTYMRRCQLNTSGFEKPYRHEGMTEQNPSIGMSSDDDKSDVENQSYYRRRPRMNHYKCGENLAMVLHG